MDLRQCTDALVYEGAGNLMLGSIDKFEITDGRRAAEVEHKTLGSKGKLLVPARGQEAIKGKITTPTLLDNLDRKLMNPRTLHDWQLHKKVDVSDEAGFSDAKSHTIVWHVKFFVMGDNGTTSELSEKDDAVYDMSIPYLRIFRDGDQNPLFFQSVFDNTHDVDGRNVWPD